MRNCEDVRVVYDQNLSEAIGQNVRRHRKAMGFSGAALAEQCGISAQQMHKYETGSNRISAEFVYHISKVLGIDIVEFFRDINDPCEDVGGAVACREFDPKTYNVLAAYNRISDPKIKKQVIALLKSLGNG